MASPPPPTKAPIALYEEAVRMNNEGVLALSHGDGDLAKLKLTDALKCCLAREQQLQQYHDTGASSGQHDQQQVIDKMSPAREALQSSELFPIPGLRNLSVKNKNSFLASSAVLLTIPASLFTLDDSRIVDGAAAVIFNLALVHHLQSIQPQQLQPLQPRGTMNNSQCESSLDAAAKLYTMMLELLCEPQNGSRSGAGKQLYIGTVMRIAAINNLAQIQVGKRHGECHQEDEDLAQMRSFLQNAELEHESKDTAVAFSDNTEQQQQAPENLQRIIHTMLFYIFAPPPAVAPAA